MPHACCSLTSMHYGLAETDQACRVPVWLMIVHVTLSTIDAPPSAARQVHMATEAQASPWNVVFNFIWQDCSASHCIAPTCHCHTWVCMYRNIYLSSYWYVAAHCHVGQWALASSYSSFSTASAQCPIDLGRPNTAPGAATAQPRPLEVPPILLPSPLCLHPRRSSKWIHDFLVWRPILLNFFFRGVLDEDIGHPAPHKPYWTNIRGSFRRWTWTVAVHG